jgi:hypothetical protein
VITWSVRASGRSTPNCQFPTPKGKRTSSTPPFRTTLSCSWELGVGVLAISTEGVDQAVPLA